jgi:hypothetical protein
VNIVSAPGRMRNISTRTNFPVGNEILIGGFIIRDGNAKRLAVRAIGPSLGAAGIPNPMANPTLELRDANQTLIASNDNWVDSPDRELLTALGLAPSSDAEAAVILNVPSGATNNGYTALVRSADGGPGVGLVEVFDLDTAAGSTILNLSTRGEVGAGDNVMIGGFITGGADDRRLVVRAIGPSLTQFGVDRALQNPRLELRNAQGVMVTSNDDWQNDPGAAEIQSFGLSPSDSRESATILTLPSGGYTVIISGSGEQPSGVALIEIFQVQQGQ